MATCNKFKDIGQCKVLFNALMPWGDYRVLSTDYTNYTIVYSCVPYLAGAYCFQLMWVLSRTPLV